MAMARETTRGRSHARATMRTLRGLRTTRRRHYGPRGPARYATPTAWRPSSTPYTQTTETGTNPQPGGPAR
eukprot:9837406-Lingulodinium_polyedra.AAC.1